MRRKNERDFLEVRRVYDCQSGSVRRNFLSLIAVLRESGQISEGKDTWLM